VRCADSNPGVLYWGITKILEQAVAELSNLPAADQEEIGRKLLSHVERLRQLRAEIDKRVRSLEAAEGRELDIEGFIRRKNAGA
jgi:hypothetical protein